MENHMVFAVEEENFAVGGAELCPENFCEFYGRKSSTDDDDSCWLHFFSPRARRNGQAASFAKLTPPPYPGLKQYSGLLQEDARRRSLVLSEMRQLLSKRPTKWF